MADKNPLISNISPPTELPSFVLQQQPAKDEAAAAESPSRKFVAAIPATSQEPQQQKAEDKSPADERELPSMQDIASALSPITEGVKNSVLFGWVKDTVKSGMKTGVQKAKESIDKVVTTLDPQMSQLICKSRIESKDFTN